MSTLNSSSFLINACILLAPVVFLRFIWRRSEPRRPPGPKRYPIIGNLLQMPPSVLWEKGLEWKKDYGDLVYLENLGKPMLIINSYETAVELLDKRSAIYSSRPHLVMADDLEGWTWLSLIAPYGKYLQKCRTYQHRFFNSPETLGFLGAQQSEARRTVLNILESPDNYKDLVSRLVGGLVMLNVYGHRIKSKDRFVELGSQGAVIIGETEQYFLLEIFPLLKYLPEWFPWSNFHRVARNARKVSEALHYEAHEATKKRIAEGTAEGSMTAFVLSENTREDGSIADENDFRSAAATMFIGGVHTTSTVIMTFVLGILKNPEAQRLGQAEIDRVVLSDRLPSFEDKERLPYVNAICEEALRYASVAPLGFPHYTTEDDEYQGYHIPAGTTVLPNQWGMSYDPEVHEEPFSFKPERWLSRDGSFVTDDRVLPHNYQFGFGRRACVGQKWAEHLLFITIATILATCDIKKAVGEDGNSIEPNEQYEQGFARSLGASKCKITPRSEKTKSLLETSVFADLGELSILTRSGRCD